MRVRPALLAAVGIAGTVAAHAQVQEFDFSGNLTQTTITFGSGVPEGTQLPGYFTGSFVYDPSAPFGAHTITDIDVNFGSFQIDKPGGGTGSTYLTNSKTLAFEDTGSIGLTGQYANLGLNGFYLTFSNPSNSQPVDPHYIDFTSFQDDSIVFDMGLGKSGEIHAIGDLKVVSAPEPSSLALLGGAALPIGLILYRRRRTDARQN